MAPPKHCGVEPQLPVVVRHGRFYPGGGQRQHPANVGRRDEVPSGTEHMRADDRAVAQGLLDHRIDGSAGPHPDGPLRPGVVLRLNRAEPAHDLARLGEDGCQELLMGESPTCNVDIPASHGAAFRITDSRSSGARLRHSCFKSFTSAARNVPRKESAVTSNAGSSFLAEVLEYKAITARASNR